MAWASASLPTASTISYCPKNATTPCAPCYIAASTIQWSFPYALQTMTVDALPYIYTYPNGTNATSISYSTRIDAKATATEYSMTDITIEPLPTFTDPNKITWVIDDFVMTYPTTYAAFYDFQGAAAATSGYNNSCAKSEQLSYLYLPEATEAASLILPLPSVSPFRNPYAVPTPVLSYLDGLATIQQQLSGHHVLECVPTLLLGDCLPNLCSTVCSTYFGKPISTSIKTSTYTTVHQPTVSTMTFVNGEPISNENTFGMIYSTYTVTTTYPLTTETSFSKSSQIFYDNPFNESTVVCKTTCNGIVHTSTSMTEIGIGHQTASVLTTVTKSAVIQAAPFPTQQAPLQTPTPTLPGQLSVPAQSAPPPKGNAPQPTTAGAPPEFGEILSRISTFTASPSTGERPPPNLPQEDNPPTIVPGSDLQPSKPCTDIFCLIASAQPAPGSSQGSGGDQSGQSIQGPPPGAQPTANSPFQPNGNSPAPGNSSPRPAPSAPATGAVIPAGSATVTAQAIGGGDGAFVLPSTTITAGQQATLPNGQIISVDSTGGLNVDGSLESLPNPSGAAAPALSGAIVTAGSQTLTASEIEDGVYAIGTTTLSEGQTATLPDGRVMSVYSTGGLEVAGSQVPVTLITPAAPAFTGVVFTAGARTLTATEVQPGVFVFDSTTLRAGRAITLPNGQVVSAGPSGIVVGGRTVPVSLMTAASSGTVAITSSGYVASGSAGTFGTSIGGEGAPLPTTGAGARAGTVHAALAAGLGGMLLAL